MSRTTTRSVRRRSSRTTLEVSRSARAVPASAALRREWPLAVSIATIALFVFFGEGWFSGLSNPAWFALILAWLFCAILVSAFAVVRHAEAVAVHLGEPLGTLVLTLAVTGMEVMLITAVMYTGEGYPSLARDNLFAVVMIVLNGMVGLSLLLGGLRHHEQAYNLRGAHAFLAVILPLVVLTLVLPNLTVSSPGPTLSAFHAIFFSLMSIALYSVFLAIQTRRHPDYFVAPAESSETEPAEIRAHALPRVRPSSTLRSWQSTCCPSLFLPSSSPCRSTTAFMCWERPRR